MTPERWQEIERVYHAALERSNHDRAAFLVEACGDDDALRLEVESLLAQEAGAAGFMSVPAVVGAQSRQTGWPLNGRQLGAYSIQSPLGIGGMGEVYRARDTKLGRDVAIKVLPAQWLADPERRARFEREARLLASLNHPHIGAIYGVEPAGDVDALVLELVEGTTLAERLTKGKPSLRETLRIATQIADGLGAAHEKGIVHRDLKPANIKITPAGVVKVLDFGLAKIASDDSAGPDLSQSPTGSIGGTREGLILGTAAYMSPEQARGQRVDKRSDIWAFGCVVYEMLTGRLAFDGETASDTIAAILSREPDWTAIPTAVPADITRLLRRCLQKDANRRLHDIADARIEIDESSNEAGRIDSKPRSRERLLWVGLVVALAGGAAIGAWSLRRSEPAAEEVRLEINTPPTFDPISLAISPDGRKLAFVATDDGTSRLWVRSIDSGSVRALARTDNASSPFWSPDNRSIGFHSEGQLKRVDLETGSVRALTAVSPMLGGTWNKDGTILFNAGTGSSLWRVSADGGELVRVTELDQLNRFHRSPQFLPDGRHFLFYVIGPASGIYVGQLESSEAPRRILEAQAGVYTASGHLFFVRDGTLLAQALDTTRLELTGSPTAIASGANSRRARSRGAFGVGSRPDRLSDGIVSLADTVHLARSVGKPVENRSWFRYRL
jgi:serine/threonine protein kinase